jgi:hypothetical protein
VRSGHPADARATWIFFVRPPSPIRGEAGGVRGKLMVVRPCATLAADRRALEADGAMDENANSRSGFCWVVLA